MTRPVDCPEDPQVLEQLAIELATVAGAEIRAAMSRQLLIEYKGQDGSLLDPVSEVDRNVEALIRARLGLSHPTHGILGEEMESPLPVDAEYVWAVDPIDGTANFVNGFPWFCASIGVLHRGRPIVGALWCSTSHLLKAGVYHARSDGVLQFDGQPVVAPPTHPQLKRRLAGDPGIAAPSNTPWDRRRTGSAALECAFVALGALQLARFERPHVWDVAGGLALVQAAGGTILTRTGDDWIPFDRFPVPGASDDPAAIQGWRAPFLLGEHGAVELASRLSS